MSFFRLVLASLRHHRRVNLAAAAGVAVATAVLVGALAVGDSMRGSLRDLALDRLGRIHHALVGERFFPAAVAESARRSVEAGGAAQWIAPAILLRASFEATMPDGVARTNGVTLVGCDRRFWEAGDVAPEPRPAAGDVVLNAPLASQLGAKVGDFVVLRFPRAGLIPAESPLGQKTGVVRSERLRVVAVLPAKSLGRFALSPNQRTPRNAFVDLAWLQDRIGRPGQVNAAFAVAMSSEDGSPASDASGDAGRDSSDESPRLPRMTLPQCGVHIERAPRGYVDLSTDRMLFEPAVERAVRESLRGGEVQPASTYLANTLAFGGKSIPYSTITALDPTERPPLGPLTTSDRRALGSIASDAIVLNRWAAEDLGAKPGDWIEVRFFEPESTHGAIHERTTRLRLDAVVELTGAADDPRLTPEWPGLTDKTALADWDPPFPFDAKRIRPRDDEYWKQHRAVPKAFVASSTGRRLWASRFGETTSFRVASSDPAATERTLRDATVDPESLGLIFRPVRRQAAAAAAGTTPFEGLFLGFSFFILTAAVLLVAILFRLGMDARAAEWGVLLAVGFRRRTVAQLAAVEGFFAACGGVVLGVPLGIGYAALMAAGLRSWWVAAIVEPFLTLHVSTSSLVVGAAVGLGTAVTAMVGAAYRVGRRPPRLLLAGRTSEPAYSAARRGPRAAAAIGIATLTAAVGVSLAGLQLERETQAGAFFGAGMLVLTGALCLIGASLAAGATGPVAVAGRGNLVRLAVRNLSRNAMRSTLTVGLTGAASFLVVSIGAFRMDPGLQVPEKNGGTGGFAVAAESDTPLASDLNLESERERLGFSDEDAKALAASRGFAFRVRSGDDAGCLNLYRPGRPQMLGASADFIARGGFAWASHVASPDAAENPWRLLQAADGVPATDDAETPIVVDKNTAAYSLGRGLGDVLTAEDEAGRPFRLRIVGLLEGSLFQGSLVMSERQFLRRFPSQNGFRFFLWETSPDSVDGLRKALERGLGDEGMTTETTGRRLAEFLAVQNTYLSTFQSLGGVGLLLGTFGLAAVQLRNVAERRGELAVLRAFGFSRRKTAAVITLENVVLLAGGLGAGLLAACVAVGPHLAGGGAAVPWIGPVAWIALVFAVGTSAGLTAVRAATATPPAAALRDE